MKLKKNGAIKFTTTNCKGSIKLCDNLNNPDEAIKKLETLINEAIELQNFITQNYIFKPTKTTL